MSGPILTPFDHRKLVFLSPAPHVFLRTPQDSFPALPPARLSPLKAPQPAPIPHIRLRPVPQFPTSTGKSRQSHLVRFLPEAEAKGIKAHPKRTTPHDGCRVSSLGVTLPESLKKKRTFLSPHLKSLAAHLKPVTPPPSQSLECGPNSMTVWKRHGYK